MRSRWCWMLLHCAVRLNAVVHVSVVHSTVSRYVWSTAPVVWYGTARRRYTARPVRLSRATWHIAWVPCSRAALRPCRSVHSCVPKPIRFEF